MPPFSTCKMVFVLKDNSSRPEKPVLQMKRIMIFTAIHLFLWFFVGFFLGSLSHGGVAVEYCDESW